MTTPAITVTDDTSLEDCCDLLELNQIRRVLVVDETGPRSADAYYAPDVHGRLRGALAVEADHFVDVAACLAEPVCTARDGAEAVRLALAMDATFLERDFDDV